MRLLSRLPLLGLACATTLALTMPAPAQTTVHYAGVNLAGAEFNSSAKPGTLYKNYVYPTESDFAYFAAQGMNTIRLPFLWERLQPTAGANLDTAQLALINTAVTRARKYGLKIILDPHNYAKYNGQRIGSSEVPNTVFADLWSKLASAFANQQDVIFGLMNEPNGIDSVTWASAAQAAIDAIRDAGADNLVLVPGVAYTGAHSWTNAAAGGGVSNGDALVGLEDPAGNMAFEVHQYLDEDYSGTSFDCVSETIGTDTLTSFTGWLRSNGKVGFLGEFAGGTDATCLTALDNMLTYIRANDDVWLGWTYWAAGAWWNTSYSFSVQKNADGTAKPQMAVLVPQAQDITGQ